MNFAEGTLWSEGGAGHQRDRHGARGRPRGPGLRPRALQRPGAALDVQRVPDPRPGHRRGDRRDRPHGRAEHRPPALASPSPPRPRAPSRPASSSPCRSATRACTPATAAASRPTAPRSSRAPAARSAPSRAAGSSRAGSRSRPAAAQLTLPSGAPAVAEPVSPTLEAFVVHAVESKRLTSISAPLVKLRFLGRDRAELDTGEQASRRCARAWPRSSRCCARTRTG